MLSKVKDYIESRKLLSHNELYIVALSGGADSVALLLLLDEMGYRLHAAHCNFHLRGEESDRDEHFCEELCAQKNIPFHRAHFDTLAYAEAHHVSVEMAARDLRYHYFEQLRKDLGAAGVCVAHHREDSVETVLLNMVRGTGLRGLTGIQPQNGYILRPLLNVSKEDIEAYLQAKRQSFVIDSTNLEADVQRNKLRLQVIPLLKEVNPSVIENIQRMAANLSEAQKILDKITDSYKLSKSLDLNSLHQYGSSEYMVFEWLRNYGFNGTQARQILAAETGSTILSGTGFEVLKDRDTLLVESAKNPFKPIRVPEEGTYVLSDDSRLKVALQDSYISKDPFTATLDAAKIAFPLTVRCVQKGDFMQPYGMRGRKLLSDLMTDQKMNLFAKRRQLVVVDATGVILWAVGLRTDNRYSVCDDTREVLELHYFLL